MYMHTHKTNKTIVNPNWWGRVSSITEKSACNGKIREKSSRGTCYHCINLLYLILERFE